MLIYHGSKDIIRKPIYGKGNKNNDYGIGFYCTLNIELAKEWACSSINVNGFANIYEIDLNKFKVLDLREEEYTILNWLAILLKHREFDINNPISNETKKYIIDNFYINIDDYDIVIGYRADDSYFSYARDFINNTISIEQLSKAMMLGELGIQIVLKSVKAFNSIIFNGYEDAESKIYYTKRLVRDMHARDKYFNELKINTSYNSSYVIDIIRKGYKHGDKIV